MVAELEETARLRAALDEARRKIRRLTTKLQIERSSLRTVRDSEQNLKALFNGTHDAIFIIAPDETVLDLNDTAVELFQAPREQLLAMNLRADLYRPRSPLEKLAEIRPRLLAGETITFQWVARRPGDNSLFPVETILRKTLWNQNTALLVTIQDITRRRQAKNLLRRRRKQLAVILDGNPIATFVIDKDHRVIFWNKACEKLTGVPKNQCLGKPVDSRIFYSGRIRPVLADLVLEMDQDRILGLYKDKNLKPSTFIPEAYEASDRLEILGVPLDLYFLAARCRDERGEVVGAIETMQDITERTRAEQELKASKRLLAEITANIPGVVYQYQVLAEGQGRFTFISDGLRAMFDLLPEVVRESPDRFFSKVAPVVRERFTTSLACSAPPEHMVDFEFSMTAPAGQRWFKNSALASRAPDGKIFWNGVVTDITEIKRTELMRADVERMVHHDLKSPLTGIGGLAKLLLKDDALTPRQKEFIGTIYQSAMKLLHMINHSMTLFKMEEQTYELTPADFDLIQVLRTLDEEFLPTVRAKSLRMAYSLDGAEMTWADERIVSGEAILLESLLANLIQNAVDAAPHGSRVTIAVRSRNHAHEIDIHNLGVIPEQIRANFFDRYVTSGKDQGTGIGTYSAMLIAKTHQGDIHFTTSDEDGTHLIVTLPKSFQQP